MKFIIKRENLLSPLQVINGVIERRQSLPILSQVLVLARGDTVTLTATDMEVEVIIEVRQQIEVQGESTLPGRKLLDICRSLPSEAQIQIICEADRGLIWSGRSRFTLATLPSSEFPQMGEFEALEKLVVQGSELKRLIDDTMFAMAHEDVRYYLNGLLLEIEATSIRAVATDGHRLAMSSMDTVTRVTKPLQVIIPRKGVSELSKMLEGVDREVSLSISHNRVQLQTGLQRFTSKLIDGRFPDYERVLPKGGDKVLIVEREVLRQGLLRNAILTSEKFKGVRIALARNLWRSWAQNLEHEEAEEEIEVNYEGDPLEIGFNVSYVLDVLSVIKADKVRFEFSNPGTSCLVRSEEGGCSQYVIMPMRL